MLSISPLSILLAIKPITYIICQLQNSMIKTLVVSHILVIKETSDVSLTIQDSISPLYTIKLGRSTSMMSSSFLAPLDKESPAGFCFKIVTSCVKSRYCSVKKAICSANTILMDFSHGIAGTKNKSKG